jgi:isoleucyl-tRNA synthetase
MYVIADGLVRMLAPILPVTADELWRHMPGKRETSVHVAEFPSRQEVDTLFDASLITQWERLIGIRDDVNRKLEEARQAKTIGTSLAARVSLRAGGETAALLSARREQLPMLFIVSQVDLDLSGTEDAVDVTVARAEGDKCARCWRIVPSLSSTPETEGLCERCVDAVGAAREVTR